MLEVLLDAWSEHTVSCRFSHIYQSFGTLPYSKYLFPTTIRLRSPCLFSLLLAFHSYGLLDLPVAFFFKLVFFWFCFVFADSIFFLRLQSLRIETSSSPVLFFCPSRSLQSLSWLKFFSGIWSWRCTHRDFYHRYHDISETGLTCHLTSLQARVLCVCWACIVSQFAASRSLPWILPAYLV